MHHHSPDDKSIRDTALGAGRQLSRKCDDAVIIFTVFNKKKV
jgi:hypothetical protein